MTMLFVSQSFASNLMPCESMEHSSSQSMLHTQLGMQDSEQNMQHAGMSHDMSTDMTMDCCDQDCACPVGACVSFAVLNSLSQEIVQNHSAKVLLPLSTILDPFQIPLNKPPIYS